MTDDQTIKEVVTALSEAKSRYHDQLVSRTDRNYDAWRGVPQLPATREADATQWNSQLFPAHAFPIVQTMTASLVDDKLRFPVKCRPRMGSPEEARKYTLGARALEMLLSHELDVDGVSKKQPRFIQQSFIAGVSIGMTYWKYEVEKFKEKVQKQELDPFLGMPLSTYEVEEEQTKVLHDDPAFDPLDIRDVFWHEAARDPQSAAWWIVRTYKSFEDLKRLEAVTLPDGTSLYQNVDKLKDQTRTSPDGNTQRETEYSGVDRTRDMIEVLEMYKRTEKGIQTCTVGNRMVVLRKWRKSPFNHGKYPFVVVSTQPDLFQVHGVAEMELIAPTQELIWDMSNQQIDALRLVANPIFAVDPGMVDPRKFKFAPGEVWPLEAPQTSIKQMEFDPTPAQIMQQQIQFFMGMLQNIVSGGPLISGAESQMADQQTATGISIITSLAQRAVSYKRQLLNWAYEDLGCQWISLLQQFMTTDRLIPRIGEDGAVIFEQVFPDEIQGEYYVNMGSAMSESQVRQENLAESQARLTMFLQAAPVFQAMGAPLNARAHYEDFLRASGVEDVDRYFTAQPQAPVPGQNGGAPAQNGSGVTSPTAYGPMSPSTEGGPSLNPASMMQQMLASTGGADNAG